MNKKEKKALVAATLAGLIYGPYLEKFPEEEEKTIDEAKKFAIGLMEEKEGKE